MAYLLDIVEDVVCSASDLLIDGADRILDAICSWAKLPADELLLTLLEEVMDGLLGGSEAHHEQGPEGVVETIEQEADVVGLSAVEEVVVMDGEEGGIILGGEETGDVMVTERVEMMAEILEGDEREEGVEVTGEVVGAEERTIQSGEGEDVREVEDVGVSLGVYASKQALSAALPGGWGRLRWPGDPVSLAVVQQESSIPEASPIEISPPEGGLFSGDAFAPTEITPPGFGVSSDPLFPDEPLPSPGRAPRPDCLDSAPVQSPHQTVEHQSEEWEDVPITFESLEPEGREDVPVTFDSFSGGEGAGTPGDGPEVAPGVGDGGAPGVVQKEVPTMAQKAGPPPYPREYAKLAQHLEFFKKVKGRKLLGMGGQGKVYGVTAVDSTGTRRKMALKVEALPPGTISSNDLYWEAANNVECRSPFIIALIGFTIVDGQLGLLFERADRQPLWNDRQVGVTARQLKRIVRYILQAVQGLALMHAIGWVHGVVKPDNFLRAGGRAKVADLGMAVPIGDASSRAGYGSPGYIAPEAYEQGPSPAADVYSVGVLINAVVTGTRPWWKYPDDEDMWRHVAAGGRFEWPAEFCRTGTSWWPWRRSAGTRYPRSGQAAHRPPAPGQAAPHPDAPHRAGPRIKGLD